jgi:hypothetical protein
MKPNFFIVGAPKCGTTFMNDCLAKHPDIFMAAKELHYFGKDIKLKAKISEQNYLSYFSKANEEKIIGEASVWYLFSKCAAEEIKKFSPNAKILIMLRNPINVMHSLHSQHLYDGNEDVLDFEAAIHLDKERRQGKKLPESVDFTQLPSYADSVLFCEQVKRYLDVFGKNQVYIMLYEDFVADTKQVIKGLLEFLEVDVEKDMKFEVVNSNKEIKMFSLHRILKKPPPLLKKITKAIVPIKKLRHLIMAKLFKWNIRNKKRKAMSLELTQKLKKYLLEDIERLAKLIDRDLSAWKY